MVRSMSRLRLPSMDVLREDYIVHDDIWHQACTAEPVMKDDCGLLCVGCIEQRLGRRLNSADFEAGVPLNASSSAGHRGRPSSDT